MSEVAAQPARTSGEFAVGGDLPVVRMGFGPGPERWERNGKPEYLRAQAEQSLRRLGLERRALPPAPHRLAWLLRRSPVLLPIPGTSTVRHLEENVAAAQIGLTSHQVQQLEALA